jgi:hypothetical protein
VESANSDEVCGYGPAEAVTILVCGLVAIFTNKRKLFLSHSVSKRQWSWRNRAGSFGDAELEALTLLKPAMVEKLPGSHHFHADPETADQRQSRPK